MEDAQEFEEFENLWREREGENLLKFLSASWLFNQDISRRYSQFYSGVLRRSIMIKFLKGNFPPFLIKFINDPYRLFLYRNFLCFDFNFDWI